MTDNELKELVAGLAVAQDRTEAYLAEAAEAQKLAEAQRAKYLAEAAEARKLAEEQKVKNEAELNKKFAEIAEVRKLAEAQRIKAEEQWVKYLAEAAEARKLAEAQRIKNEAELNKKFAEVAASQDRTDVQLAKTSSEVGSLGRGRGEIAEEFFYRSLSKTPRVGNIDFDHVYRNWAHGIGDVSDEYDVILVNGEQLLIVEVKARANTGDFWKLVKTKIPHFRLLFPTYKDYQLLGAIASLTTSDKLITKAKELGIFFLTQQGDHVALVNDEVKMF